MPRLAGDNPISTQNPSLYLTVTQTQYFLLQQWSNPDADPPLAQPTVPGRTETPGEALDHGVLKNCVGGAFCPGIEITWVSRNTNIYSEPFRIKAKKGLSQGQLNALNGDDHLFADGVEPGDLSKFMAQPWQADFNECSSQGDVSGNNPGKTWWWWPAQRPYRVVPETDPNNYADWTRDFHDGVAGDPKLDDMQMVIDWKNLGFLTQSGTRYLETERQTTEIQSYQDPVVPSSPTTPPATSSA